MVPPLDRRDLLCALAVASGAPTLLLPRRGRAASPARDAELRGTELRAIERDALGITLELGLRHGPFPHGGLPYDDDTTFVFVPAHHRGGRSIDTVVHFHGHSTNARATMGEKQLRAQVHASGRNAILVVPQGPVDAKDSRWGRLDLADGLVAFLREVRGALQSAEISAVLEDAAIVGARPGSLAISAHSGGYRVAASCLTRGGCNVNEVYLFDALYGVRDDFRSWVLARRDRHGARERHKLLAWYRVDSVAAQCAELRCELAIDGVAYRHVLDEREADPTAMTRARVGFVRSSVGHRDVVHATDALRNALSWSCLAAAPK